MLDNIRPYKMIFIQKASPNVGDAFDFAYIYKFYSNRKDICQRLKCTTIQKLGSPEISWG